MEAFLYIGMAVLGAAILLQYLSTWTKGDELKKMPLKNRREVGKQRKGGS